MNRQEYFKSLIGKTARLNYDVEEVNARCGELFRILSADDGDAYLVTTLRGDNEFYMPTEALTILDQLDDLSKISKAKKIRAVDGFYNNCLVRTGEDTYYFSYRLRILMNIVDGDYIGIARDGNKIYLYEGNENDGIILKDNSIISDVLIVLFENDTELSVQNPIMQDSTFYYEVTKEKKKAQKQVKETSKRRGPEITNKPYNWSSPKIEIPHVYFARSSDKLVPEESQLTTSPTSLETSYKGGIMEQIKTSPGKVVYGGISDSLKYEFNSKTGSYIVATDPVTSKLSEQDKVFDQFMNNEMDLMAEEQLLDREFSEPEL